MARLAKKRMSKDDIKAAAKRAEKRSKGEEVKAEASPLEPPVGETRKRGRPTEYDPAMCEQVRDLGEQGKSKAQIARTLGRSRQTLENWAKSHPEFMDALKDARELELAWWEDKGQEGLTADKFNATAFIFQVKNRFRDDYADVTKTELTGKDGGAIETKETSDLEMARRVAFMLGKAVATVAKAPA
jgi:DNA-binding transcriptional regulator YiaG